MWIVTDFVCLQAFLGSSLVLCPSKTLKTLFWQVCDLLVQQPKAFLGSSLVLCTSKTLSHPQTSQCLDGPVCLRRVFQLFSEMACDKGQFPPVVMRHSQWVQRLNTLHSDILQSASIQTSELCRTRTKYKLRKSIILIFFQDFFYTTNL